MISDETLRICLQLLDQVSIPSTAPDIVEQAQRLKSARDEITEALNGGDE